MKALSLALLAASAVASPLRRPILEERGGSQSLAVSTADVTAFGLFAQFAAAAYCNSQAAVGAPVSCTDTACPTVTADQTAVAAALGTSALSSTTNMEGLVAYDPVRNLIVVTYRGSHTIRNFIADLEFVQADCGSYLSSALAAQIGSGCTLHEGFGQAWDALRAQTFAGVAAAQQAHSGAAVVVTGHSLGGAVATLAAAELRARGTTVDLYTYGSPRVGNSVLAAFVSTQGPVGTTGGANGVAHYRVTHTDDPVPQLPPTTLLDYAHTSPEFWLSDAGTAATPQDANYYAGEILYQPADIKVCTGYTNKSCNAGEPSIDIAAHLSYFEPISGCSPDALTFKRDEEGTMLRRLAELMMMDHS